MSGTSFEHRQAAHCETGTVRNILNHYGFPISEAMVFGVGAGIFFAYLRLKTFNFPKVVNRSRPGSFLKGVPKRLGFKGEWRRYWSRRKAQAQLDQLLDEGHIVSLQVDFFPLDYVPLDFRIHGNMHFINVIGRENDSYVISDAYFPEVGKVTRKNLELARFARGEMKPRGLMFYPSQPPKEPPWERAVRKGLKSACFLMVKIPLGPLGVRGIRKFAEQIVHWPRLAGSEEKLGRELLWFAVTMEDMGTGGAGFRYMFATFLQEAADVLDKPTLVDFSHRMRENGDKWREITLKALRLGKSRDYKPEHFEELRSLIHLRADFEEAFFRDLSKEL
jgi:hypothetical protein